MYVYLYAYMYRYLFICMSMYLFGCVYACVYILDFQLIYQFLCIYVNFIWLNQVSDNIHVVNWPNSIIIVVLIKSPFFDMRIHCMIHTHDILAVISHIHSKFLIYQTYKLVDTLIKKKISNYISVYFFKNDNYRYLLDRNKSSTRLYM